MSFKPAYELASRIQRRFNIDITPIDAAILRIAERRLHRWHERECGDSDNYTSWCLVRDEDTGIPYCEYYPHTGKSYRIKVRDIETAELAKVKTICTKYSLHYYQQTDPRGCALYISNIPLADDRYSSDGIACCD